MICWYVVIERIYLLKFEEERRRCLLEIQKPVWGANWRAVKPARATTYVNPDRYHYVLLILALGEKWTLLVSNRGTMVNFTRFLSYQNSLKKESKLLFQRTYHVSRDEALLEIRKPVWRANWSIWQDLYFSKDGASIILVFRNDKLFSILW